MSDAPKNNNQKPFSALSLAWSFGWNIALPLAVLALLGRWLDKKWGTTPWLLISGMILAIAVSSYLMYKKMMEIIK